MHKQKPAPLTAKQKKDIAHASGTHRARDVVQEIAKSNLTPAIHNRKIMPAHLELVIIRVAAGDLLINVCEELGISSGALYQRAVDDADYARRLDKAHEIGAKTLFQRMVQCAWNDQESVERSKLKVAVLDRIARTYNRNLSDRQQIDIRQAVAYILPSDADDF